VTEDARSLTPRSTISLRPGITVADVENEASGDDPITSSINNNNPFEWDSDEDDDNPEDSGLGEFVEDIIVPSCGGTHDLFMRALLDTGMKVNAMSQSKWRQTGFKREEYLGRRLVTANGKTFYPRGQVRIQFYFKRRKTAKTWEVKFLIVPDEAPFDVALGSKFIRQARLLEKNDAALVLVLEKLTPEERADMVRKTQAANQQHPENKKRQLEAMQKRRRGREAEDRKTNQKGS